MSWVQIPFPAPEMELQGLDVQPVHGDNLGPFLFLSQPLATRGAIRLRRQEFPHRQHWAHRDDSRDAGNSPAQCRPRANRIFGCPEMPRGSAADFRNERPAPSATAPRSCRHSRHAPTASGSNLDKNREREASVPPRLVRRKRRAQRPVRKSEAPSGISRTSTIKRVALSTLL